MLFACSLFLSLAAVCAANAQDGFVKYGIQPVQRRALNLPKRQHRVGLASDLGLIYLIELGVGTPPQPVYVQLDTGSTDLWISPNCSSTIDDHDRSVCYTVPTFNPTKSNTFRSLNSTFLGLYGGGNTTWEWAKDSITVGSSVLKAQQFGLNKISYNEPFGILGVAPPFDSREANYTYFIDSLRDQGITASRAFSVDLQTNGSTDSNIIFGGVDTAKYIGSLETLPTIPESEAQALGGNRYWMTLNGISLNINGTTVSIANANLTTVTDAGSGCIYLSPDQFKTLGDAFPGSRLVDLPGGPSYVIDCAAADLPGSIDFKFGNKTIVVPFNDLIVSVDEKTCMIGAYALPTEVAAGTTVLGDVFFRNAYLVFDQDNKNVHVAQAANCGTNIVKIGTGPDAVPSITGRCSATATASSTSPELTSTPPVTAGVGKMESNAVLALLFAGLVASF